jgi:hypothetical protein
MEIVEPNDRFDFDAVSLAHPTGVQGGAYFTKLNYAGKGLYIQTPKSLTKHGIIKNGKKIYTELVFMRSARCVFDFLALGLIFKTRIRFLDL